MNIALMIIALILGVISILFNQKRYRLKSIFAIYLLYIFSIYMKLQPILQNDQLKSAPTYEYILSEGYMEIICMIILLGLYCFKMIKK